MADIELRFHRDMLVLSAPIDVGLARQGIDAGLDRQYLNLMEPDVVVDALRLETLAGAQCLVTTTQDLTAARLAHVRMDGDASKLAAAALDIAAELKPQHVFVEIGPCGLPIDPSSKASLNEVKAQYADAARLFEGRDFDAFFLNGFTGIDDMRCALMGVAQVSGKPVVASMTLGAPASEAASASAVGGPGDPRAAGAQGAEGEAAGAQGAQSFGTPFSFGSYDAVEREASTYLPHARRPLDPARWAEAVALMADLGAAVVGFETADPIGAAVGYARTAVEAAGLPVLAQLQVADAGPADAARRRTPAAELPDYAPDTLEHAAVKLYGAGVQFLRATGAATPACTGALAATVFGLDARSR